MPHILLAEDDESMRRFLSMALERAGFGVTVANDGLDALNILQNSETRFDLLLADIVMPGMDGIELSQRATERYPELKVMFITGFAAVALGRQAETANTAKVLSKPFHLKDLVDQITTLLETESAV